MSREDGEEEQRRQIQGLETTTPDVAASPCA